MRAAKVRTRTVRMIALSAAAALLIWAIISVAISLKTAAASPRELLERSGAPVTGAEELLTYQISAERYLCIYYRAEDDRLTLAELSKRPFPHRSGVCSRVVVSGGAVIEEALEKYASGGLTLPVWLSEPRERGYYRPVMRSENGAAVFVALHILLDARSAPENALLFRDCGGQAVCVYIE